MIILDTDHLTVLRYRDDSHYMPLKSRIDRSVDQQIVTTAVTVEEQMRGWLVEINRWRDVQRQVTAYDRLAKIVEFLADWTILRFDNAAAAEFNRLRKAGVRIGTQDLKIAAIALTQDATLLSANLRHFRQVPDLRVQDWLH